MTATNPFTTSFVALTTTFTPRASCFSTPFMMFGNPAGVWWAQGDDKNKNCWPPKWNPDPASPVVFSPGICPSGFTSACDTKVTTSGSETEIVTCCPSNYACVVPNPQRKWESPGRWGCVTPLASVASVWSIPPTATVVISSMYQKSVMVVARPVETSGTGATSTSPAGEQSTSGAPDVESKPKPSGLTSGAKAGIGVGVAIGAIMIGLLAYIAWRMSWRTQGDRGDKSESQLHEVQGSSRINEADTYEKLEMAAGTRTKDQASVYEMRGTDGFVPEMPDGRQIHELSSHK